MVNFDEIKFDCRLYNGYKPCIYGNECKGCPWYAPHNIGGAGWKPKLETAPLHGLPADAEILIIKTGALGDVLRTTTLLYPLKRMVPSARVTWITSQPALPLLEDNPLIDSLVAMESAPALKLILGKSYDALICLEKEGPQLSLCRDILANRHAGYYPTPWNTATVANTEARYMMVLGVNDELKFHGNTKSYPQIICESVGLPFQRDPYILTLTSASTPSENRMRRLIKNQGPVIGLNTGCGAVFRTKQWTLEGWVETARTLLQSSDANVILMGGTAEEQLNRAIIAAVPGLIDAGPDNPMKDFFGIVNACDVVVTSDSLGMHIAIALQKHVVALFGSTSYHEIDLYERGEKVITDFPCSPCYLKTCDKKPTCMEAMSASIVVDAVKRGIVRSNPTIL